MVIILVFCVFTARVLRWQQQFVFIQINAMANTHNTDTKLPISRLPLFILKSSDTEMLLSGVTTKNVIDKTCVIPYLKLAS